MRVFSLDADIITKLLKKHPANQTVIDRFRAEVRKNSVLIICPVVFYEIRRELILKNAVTQQAAFQGLVESMEWKEFGAPVWERASQLWSTLRRRGLPHVDADVLIAAHALEYDAVIVTNNVSHFENTGAETETWSVPV